MIFLLRGYIKKSCWYSLVGLEDFEDYGDLVVGVVTLYFAHISLMQSLNVYDVTIFRKWSARLMSFGCDTTPSDNPSWTPSTRNGSVSKTSEMSENAKICFESDFRLKMENIMKLSLTFFSKLSLASLKDLVSIALMILLASFIINACLMRFYQVYLPLLLTTP